MDIQDMKNIKPNSHKARAMESEKKEIRPVVSGAAKTKKKNGLHNLKDAIISEDASSVGSYVFMEVLIPAIKNAIIDIVTDSVNMVFGGDGRSSRRSGVSTSHVNYRKYSEPRERYNTAPAPSRQRFDCDEIIFASKGDAEAVLSQMIDIMDSYDGVVTVADLYDLADLTQPYTANKYGWTNLRNATTQRVRDGYILKLPRPMPID